VASFTQTVGAMKSPVRLKPDTTCLYASAAFE